MSTTGVKSWSQTAATNASADSTVNWAEGQAPSTVNDSARAMMASVAKYRDDIAGATVTGGGGSVYTLATYQQFQSLAEMNGQIVAFTASFTNTGACALNVDSLGNKTIQLSPGVDLPAGTLVSGVPYVALYNASAGIFYLQNFYGTPYSIPIGGMMPFIGTTAPNSSFVLPYGQAISRTTYSVLFALCGTSFGTGDGSTTFNLPDLRGRIPAGKDDMGGSAASRLTASYFGTSAAALGATGGSQSQVLVTSNLPPYTPAGSVTTTISSPSGGHGFVPGGAVVGYGGGETGAADFTLVSLLSASSSFTGTAQGGSSTAFAIAQPTIIMNYLVRII